MHRFPLLSVDSIFSELLVKETRLKSHYEKEIISTLNPFVLAVPSKSSSNNQNRTSMISPKLIYFLVYFSSIFESLRLYLMKNYGIFTQICVFQGFNAKEQKTSKKNSKYG